MTTSTGIFRSSGGKWYLMIIIVLLIVIGTARSLQITESVDSVSVQHGSSSGIVLDCPYELDVNDSYGLEIKWYFNDKPRPVYQWIPENKPQDLGILSGRLDLSHQVSSDKFLMHRALSILEPTTELTGNYSCWVSNFFKEDRMTTLLTVYTPASDFIITHDTVDMDSVLIYCSADGLYPEPQLALFRLLPDTETYQYEDADIVVELELDNGTYTITLEKTYMRNELYDENKFLCSLNINETEYQLNKEITYYAEQTTTTSLPTTTPPITTIPTTTASISTTITPPTTAILSATTTQFINERSTLTQFSQSGFEREEENAMDRSSSTRTIELTSFVLIMAFSTAGRTLIMLTS